MKKLLKFCRSISTQWKKIRKRNKRFDDGKKQGGFSFVETLAVLSVTAILASQAGTAAFNMVQKARVSSAKTQIESLKASLQAYYIDCGAFPTGEQGLSALWEKPVLHPVPENWNGPYTDKKIPKDPWGNPFFYRHNGELFPSGAPESAPYIVISYGADGVEGGDKNALDIVSWE